MTDYFNLDFDQKMKRTGNNFYWQTETLNTAKNLPRHFFTNIFIYD